MKPVRVPPGLFVEIEPETDSEGRERRRFHVKGHPEAIAVEVVQEPISLGEVTSE